MTYVPRNLHRRIDEIERSKREQNNGQGDYMASALQARNEYRGKTMSWNQQQESEKREYEEAWLEIPKQNYDGFYGRAPAVDRRFETGEKEMGLMAKDSGGGDFKTVPEGTHLARCYRVIDLGVQTVEWAGERKQQLKILLGWELFGDDDDGQPLQTDDGKPLVISKRYTNNLGKKSNLRADLESWRGKAFSDQELHGFPMTNLLNQWCLLGVIHNTKGDKTYANVQSISALPKAMKASLPKPVHEAQSFDLDLPDLALFETFHDRLKETIMASAEWRNQKGGSASQAKGKPATSSSFDDLKDDDDFLDIPF